ncbi:hypothetical protein FOA43_001820 [Brettanomyces nanus]|uniref:Uncharacterized protein n=1 Tax=Eeniella nana TaxID=13502 RepID=A0A875RP28_EENNA|nr:uncharacterized protein FOA43_001820 [Brettanomyces nanus]QPG74490.1 hypothetical protein FOA43_001820 [Brettanomyces nanus]
MASLEGNSTTLDCPDLVNQEDISFERAKDYSDDSDTTRQLDSDYNTLHSIKKKCQDVMKELAISDITEIDKELEPDEKEKKRHIRQLNRYNELKDTAMQLISMIAEQRGLRIKDVMNEIGVEGE